MMNLKFESIENRITVRCRHQYNKEGKLRRYLHT